MNNIEHRVNVFRARRSRKSATYATRRISKVLPSLVATWPRRASEASTSADILLQVFRLPESGGDIADRDRPTCRRQCGKHGGGLADRVGGERKFARARLGQPEFGGDLRAFLFGRHFVEVFAEARNLVVGPQPAHVAALFLRRAFAIERHKLFQNLLVGQRLRPAVGFEYQPVELVVQLLQNEC